MNGNRMKHKILREYVRQTLIMEDSASSGGIGLGSAVESPYGAHVTNKSDVYNFFVKPFIDPFKIALVKAKELKIKTITFITVLYESIATAIDARLSDDYEKIFMKEKQELDDLKSKHKDVYDSIWSGFKGNDAAAFAFFCYPGLLLGSMVARSDISGTIDLLSSLSGGSLNPFLRNIQKKKVTPDAEELNPFLTGKVKFSSYAEYTGNKQSMGYEDPSKKKKNKNESVIRENRIKSIKDIIFSKQLIDEAINSPEAKEMQQKSREVMENTLQEIIEKAKLVASATTIEQLRDNLEMDELDDEIEKLNKVAKSERNLAEKKLIQNVKKSMKKFYIKNLTMQVKQVIDAGVPKDHPFVKKYYDVIKTIQSM